MDSLERFPKPLLLNGVSTFPIPIGIWGRPYIALLPGTYTLSSTDDRFIFDMSQFVVDLGKDPPQPLTHLSDTARTEVNAVIQKDIAACERSLQWRDCRLPVYATIDDGAVLDLNSITIKDSKSDGLETALNAPLRFRGSDASRAYLGQETAPSSWVTLQYADTSGKLYERQACVQVNGIFWEGGILQGVTYLPCL